MKKSLFFLSCAAIMVFACEKQKPAEPASFSVDKTEIKADPEGGSSSVVITSNVGWTASLSSDQDWATIDKTSGKGNGNVMLTFAENLGDERSAVLTITPDSKDVAAAVININQAAQRSEMRLGDPFVENPPVKGVVDAFEIKIPYFDAIGNESVDFSLTFSDVGAAGLEAQTITCNTFTKGSGNATLLVLGTPGTLGPLSIAISAMDESLNPIEVKVIEQLTHTSYINWNNYSIGWIRAICNLLRGSAYDYSWTSQALNPTTSGVGTDHKVLPTGTTLTGCEDAYLSLVCANPIVAAGQSDQPGGTPPGLAGYQFNPGYQVQGMIKDDYIFVYIPKVSVKAGGKITVESSVGGAKAAANAYLVEYSTDNKNWTAFADPKTLTVEGTDYLYHFMYATAYNTRYVYSRNDTEDPSYGVITATASSAINGSLYIRFRCNGINGASVVQTGTG